MIAVEMRRFGGPDVFELVTRDTPMPGPGEALVRVAAAGVNFADTLLRQDRYVVTAPLPAVLGNEVTGTVEAVGEGVDASRVGTRVAGALFAVGALGGYASHVRLDARYLVPLPDALSFDDAAALMVQGLSALYLTRQASPRGKTVLVSAAAGGVGSLLVQLARRAGARIVVGAASTLAKRDVALSLGADAVIDYTAADWVEQARAATGGVGPDIVYESTGGSVTRRSLEALAPLGELVIYGALNVHDFDFTSRELVGLVFKNQSLKGFALVPLLTPSRLREDLGALFELARDGSLRVTTGGVYALERAGDAHRALETRATTGKLILRPG
jgi:NADPH2:quinone reductase